LKRALANATVGRIAFGECPIDRRLTRYYFNQDIHCRAMAQGDARSIDLAETGGAPGYFGDEDRLSKAHFPEALAKILVALEQANTACGASGELAKRRKMLKWRRH
jgi:hypothetical protein